MTMFWDLYSTGVIALVLSDDLDDDAHGGSAIKSREQAVEKIYASLSTEAKRSTSRQPTSKENRLACVRWYVGTLLLNFLEAHRGLVFEAARFRKATYE